MGIVRATDTPLDRLLARRAAHRLAAVLPEAMATLAALSAAGSNVALVGSLARGTFGLNSDVDFLIVDRGPLSDTQIFNIVCDHLKAAPFDLVFADRLSPISLGLMRRDAGMSA